MTSSLKILLSLSRTAKFCVLIATDSLLLTGSLWLSLTLSFDYWYWPIEGMNNPIIILVLLAPVIGVPVFVRFGLYRSIIRYLSLRSLWSIMTAVLMYSALWTIVVLLTGVQGNLLFIIVLNFLFSALGVLGSRIFASWFLRKIEDSIIEKKISSDAWVPSSLRVVIFGAGAAGRQLALTLEQSREYILLAFVDDSLELQGRDLMGLPILSQEKLSTFAKSHKVDEILLAMPSISRKRRSLIIERSRHLNVRIRTLPGLIEMAQGKVNYSDINDLDINDLLGREPAEPDEEILNHHVTGKIVLVTGAGGSIGSELCRQILKRKPKVLLLFELSEFALYNLQNELSEKHNSFKNRQHDNSNLGLVPSVIPLLGSVADERRVSDIISTWKPNIIYHAAALKHVPIVEQNITECIKNNIIGTLVMARVASKLQVGCFTLVSTDKAVNPANAMGASKRCCELILQALSVEQNPSFDSMYDGKFFTQVQNTTQFSMVRFGNVLDSSGSVVPRFRQQIAQGGPITLTHQDITRYFMTISEAAQLVMQASAMTENTRRHVVSEAEVYVLDMGEPVKIIDLARRMIQLSGYRVKDKNLQEGDIAIEEVGLRPGEKLYEELLIGNNPKLTQHPRIMKANEKFLPWGELQPMITKLQIAAFNGDVDIIRSTLQMLVPEYKPNQKVFDLVYKQRMYQNTKHNH